MLAESVAVPVCRSFGCFCSSCRSLGTGTRWYKCKELVDLGITPSDHFCVLGSVGLDGLFGSVGSAGLVGWSAGLVQH